MIPTCILINDIQKNKLLEFVGFIREYKKKNKYEEDEDTSMASSFTWHIFSTGLGDQISVESHGFWCYLTILDDGEIINCAKDWTNYLKEI